MHREQQVADELTQIARAAADALVRFMQGGGVPTVLIEPALNSVSDPVRAAVVEREWLRTCWTPDLLESQMPETFRAMEVRTDDMLAHLGPRWMQVIDGLMTLIGSDYSQWVDSLDSDVDTDELRGRIGARAARIESRSAAAGLKAEWENTVMLPQIITQYNGGR